MASTACQKNQWAWWLSNKMIQFKKQRQKPEEKQTKLMRLVGQHEALQHTLVE